MKMPLSRLQRRIWLHDQLLDGPAYNTPVAVRVAGIVDAGVLHAALRRLVERHEVLRTVVSLVDGEPVGRLHPPVDVPLALYDVASDDDPWAAALRHLEEHVGRRIDTSQAPLIRCVLVRLGVEDHLLVLIAHHIAWDAESSSIFLRDLYGAAESRESLVSFAEAVRRREGQVQRSAPESRRFWRDLLRGAGVRLPLPESRTGATSRSPAGVSGDLTEPVRHSVKSLAIRRGCSVSQVILAAWLCLLHRYTGQRDLVTGLPRSWRTGALVDVIGPMIDIAAVRVRVDPGMGFGGLVEVVRDRVLEVLPHTGFPVEEALDDSAGVKPAFTVLFSASEGMPRGDIEGARFVSLPTRGSREQLALHTTVSPAEVRLDLEFPCESMGAEDARGLLRALHALLAEGAEEPERPLWSLGCGTGSGPAQVPRAEGPFLPHAVWDRAVADPSAVALIGTDRRLRYGELHASARALAARLIRLGVRGESVVGIATPDRVDRVVCFLGVWYAGGVPWPIDPLEPGHRLARMVADARPALVLTAEAQELPDSVGSVRAEVWSSGPDPGVDVERPTIHPEQAAYLLFTSGSTGGPKGVIVPHRGIACRIRWMQDRLALGGAECVLHRTRTTFDVSLWEFLWPLSVGARVSVISREEMVDPELLVGRMVRDGISVAHFVPSLLRRVLDHPGLQAVTTLRCVVASGEALGSDLVEATHAQTPAEVFNLYGPTEASIDVTVWRCARGDPAQPVPIGHPIEGATVVVLGPELSRVPQGGVGEIFLSGELLARGYRNRPRKTAETFLPHPFGPPGGRMYATGDRGRERVDGALEFRGRRDGQVKIRGHRIELAEVEAALREHPLVRDCAAAVLPHPGGGTLAAFVCARDAVSAESLRRHATARLPGPMVPSAFELLDEIPVTAHGKVDRLRLAEIPLCGLETSTGQEPRTDVERALVEIWTGVLGRRPGIHDDFFRLGGDSIQLMQVVAQAARQGLRMRVRDLAAWPTIADLAARIVEDPRGAAASEPERASAPLTPVQRWFVSLGLSRPDHWNLAMALEVRGPLDPGRLRSAMECVVERHAALRVRFDGGADWTMHLRARGSDLLAVHRDVELRSPEGVALVERLHRSLDLRDGPVIRAVVLGPPASSVLVVVAHHLVVDPLSLEVIARDLDALYTGTPPEQLVRPTSFLEWAARLPAPRPEPGADELLDLPLGLPTDHVLLEDRVGDTQTVTRRVPVAVGSRRMARTCLVAAWASSLCDWCGSGATILDVELHGRDEPSGSLEVAASVGWFTEIVALAVVRPSEDTAGAWLSSVETGWERRSRRVRDGSGSFMASEILLNFLGRRGPPRSGGSLVLVHDADLGTPRGAENRRTHLLEILSWIEGDELVVRVEYAGRVFERQTIASLVSRMESRYVALASSTSPATVVEEGVTLGGAELELLLGGQPGGS